MHAPYLKNLLSENGVSGSLITISLQQLRWPSGKSVRLWSSRLGFDSESGQTNDFKIGIHSFPA